jgi:F-type H+-transporting ATPase subunit a
MSQLAGQLNTENTQPETQHEATLFAEPIAHLGRFTITNSLLSSWITVIILVIFFYFIGQKIKKIPRGIQNIFEILMEKALELTDSVTGNRPKSEKFLPIVLALFLFILINNWLGLLPGVGTVGFNETEGAHSVFVPFLRGGTADINTTLSLALFSVIISHIFGIVAIGGWNYLNKYVNLNAFASIPKEIKKDFSVVLVNPIKAFVGVVELIGEMAKVASLSFRLFGNIFAGEVLLASMMAIFAYFLPLPFIFLEIIVGFIQALIFAMLTLVYLSVATQHHAEH